MSPSSFPSTQLHESRRLSLRADSVFSGVRGFVRQLSPGDQFIALVLGVLVILTSLVGLFALARAHQVVVPAYGGTLREGVVGAPRFVNPLLAISDTDRDLVALTYAGLMGHDGAGALVPVLAQSYTVSEDGTTYTFALRPNATFSDGTPVTADDVVYTVEKAQDPSLKSPLLANWANIRAETVDARTVRFILPKAYAPFLEDTTLGILPQHVWRDVANEEFPFSPYATNPIGAGPFKVDSVTRASNGVITSYRLSAFGAFATGRPYLAHITMSFFADQASLKKAFASGTITSAYGIASKDAHAVPYSRIFGVFFNQTQEPLLTDAGVRKALSLAIDRSALVKDVLGNYATPLMGPLPGGSGVNPVPLPDPATRLDEARQTLTSAGWTFDTDQNVWSKKGEILHLTLTTSNVPELKSVAAAVQSDWQALGIPTELKLYEPNELTQTVIRPRAYGALLFGEVIGSDPDLYAFWSSNEQKDPGLNITGYADKTTDALLESVRAGTDGQGRLETLDQIQDRIASDYPAAFLYTPDFLYSVPSSLSGVALTRVGSPSDRFWDVSHWYTYTEHVWPWFAR
ncbi:MAG: peptide ABC transporter substrate-binding protein [Patescibacteria group bacterium]